MQSRSQGGMEERQPKRSAVGNALCGVPGFG
jgi:hypothetical protein